MITPDVIAQHLQVQHLHLRFDLASSSFDGFVITGYFLLIQFVEGLESFTDLILLAITLEVVISGTASNMNGQPLTTTTFCLFMYYIYKFKI